MTRDENYVEHALHVGEGLTGLSLQQLEGRDRGLDAGLDLVEDRASGVHALPGGILQDPVLVALAGEVGAFVTAAHDDPDVEFLHGLGC